MAMHSSHLPACFCFYVVSFPCLCHMMWDGILCCLQHCSLCSVSRCLCCTSLHYYYYITTSRVLLSFSFLTVSHYILLKLLDINNHYFCPILSYLQRLASQCHHFYSVFLCREFKNHSCTRSVWPSKQQSFVCSNRTNIISQLK